MRKTSVKAGTITRLNPRNWLFSVLVSLLPLAGFAQSLSIHVLDVGEGQAVLLHKNQRGILIDTGHAGAAASVVRRFDELQVHELDYLILSHLHPDHASGLFRLTEAFPEARVADNCHKLAHDATPDLMRWINDSLDQHPRRNCLKAGDTINWQGARLTVLWPQQSPGINDGVNHGSLVLLVQYGQQSLLVMGDAGFAAESSILSSFELNPVDILIVGHHGASDASSEEFLRAVQPQHAVISINANNFRGYPAQQTLQRLSRYSGEILKTYEKGEIEFLFK